VARRAQVTEGHQHNAADTVRCGHPVMPVPARVFEGARSDVLASDCVRIDISERWPVHAEPTIGDCNHIQLTA
jgi:hypothetical protein